ncbi:MAG: hypothetical protein V3U37_06430 [Nitrospinaceae bacterium]
MPGTTKISACLFALMFLASAPVHPADPENTLVGNTGKTVKELATQHTVNILKDLNLPFKKQVYTIEKDKLVEVGPGSESEYSGLDYLFEDFWTYYLRRYEAEPALPEEDVERAAPGERDVPPQGDIMIDIN